jgi:hypothetical protein
MILLMLGFVAFAAHHPCREPLSSLTAQKNLVLAKKGV